MNRHFLSEWSKALSDVEFAQALVIAGTLERQLLAWADNAAHSARKMDVRYPWSLSQASASTLPSPGALLAQWNSFAANHSTFGLLIESSAALDFEERCDFAHAMSTLPEVLGVAIECANSWANATPWRLPFSIAALDEDPIAQPLIERNQSAPPNWPFRFAVATRQFDRHPVLVISLPINAARTALLGAPPKLKANLIILNGLGGETLDRARSLMGTIAARISLSGVALIRETLSNDDLVTAIQRFAFEMTHDVPVDAAIATAFGDDAILYGNVSLLREARMSTQVRSLSARMTAMPKTSRVAVGERSAAMLTRSKPLPSAASIRVDARAGIMMSAPPEEMSAAMASAAPEFEFAGESQEASALTELAGAMRKTAAVGAAEIAATRCVQQQCFVRATPAAPLTKVTDTFVANEAVLLKVRIGNQNDGEWQSSTVAFPDHELPANESKHRLTVMFHEPNHFEQPMLANIELPSVGTSNEAEFEFTPKTAANFEARVSIIHRGRVLQTALLRTQVLSARANATLQHKIEFFDETHVRHDWTSLDQRARFDLAFICNRDDTHIERLTAVSDDLAWSLDLGRIDATVTRINNLLSDAASNIVDHDRGLDAGANPELLSKLAFAGRELFLNLLHEQLRNRAAGSLDLRSDQVSHIQIVGTRIGELVPIEFIYDYPLSAFDVAPAVCPKHREGLERGECPGECAARRAAGEHICPNGFWGVRKVVERHLFDGAAAGREAAIIAGTESNAVRNTLAIREHVVIGHSRRVLAPTIAPLIADMKAALGDRLTTVAQWKEWVAAVETHAPSWLIAFPHNEDKGDERKLEIGDMKIRTVAFAAHDDAVTAVDPAVDYFVRVPGKPPPLVFLLGCDTAGALDDSGSHLDAFRRGGAAIIVSTVATVFGEHAVAMGAAIAKNLLAQDADAHSGKMFGEVLRDAKRTALLDSVPMALGIVAFGDADWRLQ